MTTHELETGQTVIAAVVPRNTENHYTGICRDPNDDRADTLALFYKDIGKIGTHALPLHFDPRKYKISLIGTIQHPGVFSFDPTPFVEMSGFTGAFRDYNKHKLAFESWFCTKEASFLSRLASWGYYWDNPCGEKSIKGTGINDSKWSAHQLNEWHKAESRKLSVEQMVVVILIKKV